MKRGDHRTRHETEGLFVLKAKPGEGFCMVRGCRKEGHSHKFGLCHGHYQYRWRMLNKKQSAYATLRDHAKQRGIKFTISYDYFLGLTDCAAFWQPSPENFADHVSIDRVDASRGYEPGNLRVISVSENSFKANRERYLPSHVQAILDRKRARVDAWTEESNCPF